MTDKSLYALKPAVKAEFIKRLESGEYEQGKRALRTNDGSYCCLGVLCTIARDAPELGNTEYLRDTEDPSIDAILGLDGSLPWSYPTPNIIRWALETPLSPRAYSANLMVDYEGLEWALTSLNDGPPRQGKEQEVQLSFRELAKLIREQL